MPPVRPTLAALVLVVAAVFAPTAQAILPFQHLTGPGPITSLNLGNDLTCQMTVAGDPQPSFEPIGSDLADCATYVLVTNTSTGEVTLFGPSDRTFIPNGDVPFVPDPNFGFEGQQSVPAGNGTTAVGTQVNLSGTGLTLTQSDVFNTAQDFYSTGLGISNSDPNVAYDVTVSHLFLCYLQSGPSGDFGFRDVFGGLLQPGCATGPDVTPVRRESLTALATPVNWAVVPYTDTGTLLRGGAFPDAGTFGESLDLMVGLSWTRHIDAGGSLSDIAWQTRSSGPQGGAAPVPEKSGTASTESGTVLVQAPGGQFVPLAGTQSIPVGSLVDTTKGVVRLKAAASGKVKTRTGSFGGGVFRFTQKRQKVGRKRLLTTRLALRGGNFAACRTRGADGTASRRRVVRYLKAKASGRFAVVGKNSSGLERGTRWTTSDTCAGTLTAVQQGAVAVTDFGKRKTVIVRAGRSYLARPGR